MPVTCPNCGGAHPRWECKMPVMSLPEMVKAHTEGGYPEVLETHDWARWTRWTGDGERPPNWFATNPDTKVLTKILRVEVEPTHDKIDKKIRKPVVVAAVEKMVAQETEPAGMSKAGQEAYRYYMKFYMRKWRARKAILKMAEEEKKLKLD